MSAQSIDPTIDPTKYYPPYINPNPELTPDQFQLIQNSWKLIKAGQFDAFREQELISDPLGLWGMLFYETLFDLDPALKPMFKNKFRQSTMLTEMVSASLGLLPGAIDEVLGEERIDVDSKLIPMLINLAERHVHYQVKAKHYGTVGLAIVTTLEKALGNSFDEKTKAAWVELWSLMCTVMISAHVKKAQEMGVEI